MNIVVDNTMSLRGANNITSTPNNNNNLVDENKDKSGRREDGSGEDALRPKVYDGDILELFTINGAVISLILETDQTYNDSIYNTIINLDSKDILSHISVTDKNVESDSRMIVVNGYVSGEDVILYYIEHKDISGDYDIYKVVLHKNGSYTRTHNNTATGFYRVGSDGTFWVWDEESGSYISTGIQVVGNLYDIRLFSANGSQFMRAGQQTDIVAEVWNMDRNITDNVAPEHFTWQRSSGNQILDNIWNLTHQGVGKTIRIQNSDINKACTFYCLIPVEVLNNIN